MTKKLAWLAVLAALAGCSTTAAPPVPPAPPPPPQAAGAESVGAGSKPGFCTFKDANGVLFEKKC